MRISDWSSDVCSSDLSMMPLVEIVRHDTMDAETERRLAAFCRAIDKLPVPVAGSPGFLVNRVLFPYILEAITCHGEGIPGPVIDRAAAAFGMPMGPIEQIGRALCRERVCQYV